MEDRKQRCSRRKFLTQAAALTLTGGLSQSEAVFARPPRPAADGRRPIAVLCTVYRPLSHTFQLAGRFLHGWAHEGRLHVPDHYVRSLYVDQAPDNDLSRAVGKKFGVQVTRSVTEALTAGGNGLAVEGVLISAEHGNYPRNERGQVLYPRYELLQQVVTAFRQTGRAVPVFTAKHLTHNAARAHEMIGWSRELGFPLMAGSHLPLTWRRPDLELPAGAGVTEALVAAHGPVEVFGSDALEALQAMVERRRGGESGVKAVTCLTGNAVWKAGDAGLWSWELLEAALARSETAALGDVRRNVGQLAVQGMPATPATAFLVEYRDGLRGTVLLLNGHVQDFSFAARVQGESQPASCLFVTPPPPGCRAFNCLAGAVDRFFTTAQPPYPVERTLLTTCLLEAVMESHRLRGARIESPQLDVRYTCLVER